MNACILIAQPQLEATMNTTAPIPGSIRTMRHIYARHECENCGEPATKCHAFILPNARHNPASSGYGKDDISWCSDAEAFSCDKCPEPRVDGMRWGASWGGPRYDHMLHFWSPLDMEIADPADAQVVS